MGATADNASATFSLDLDASGAASSARDAAGALEMLRAKLEADTTALRGMQQALSRLKGGAGTSSTTIKGLQAQISAQKATIAQAQQRYLDLGGSFAALKRPAADATTSLKQLLAAARGSPGPLGALLSRLGGITGLLGAGALAAGIVATAAAFVALAAAATIAVAALAKYGVAQADARRSELLRLEGLSKMRNFWLESFGIVRKADSAEFLQRTIDKATASVALGRDEVSGLAADFYRAGLRAGNLQAAVEGASIAMATQGEAGLAQFKALALGASVWGRSVKQVANDYKARLGGIAARQLLSLDVQQRKLKENFNFLFSGLKIEKLLEASKVITDMFSQSTASGRALKALIEGLLQPLIDFVSSHGLVFKRFFQGMIIAALQFGLVILELRDRLRGVFGGKFLEGIDATNLALNLGIGFVSLLIGGFVGLGVAAAVAAASMALALAPILAIGAAAYYARDAIAAVFSFLANNSWLDIGLNVVKGIALGIKSGVSWVVDAIGTLATTMRKVFAERLRMHSPSRLFRDDALNVPKGAAIGVRDGIPQVRRATADMTSEMERVGPRSSDAGTAPGAPAASGAAPSSGGGDMVVHLSFGDLHLNGAETGNDPKKFAREVFEEIAAALRGARIQLAAPLGAP